MKLVIGNKNYSSWSMRPWVAMREFGIPFDEVMLRFDTFTGIDSAFKREILKMSPAGRVPLLVLDDGLAVWDTLAIAETLAERFPQHALWPRDAAARARARSLCAEMHAGFAALRTHCGMNVEARLPDVGARVLAEQPAVRADLARLDAAWSDALAAHGGPMLFGAYSLADAYFAPVAMRVRTYALPLSAPSQAWVERVLATRGVREWEAQALVEHDFVAEDERYRTREQAAAAWR